ncbi:serine protein kinase RIO [Alkalilimnicola ehrlichii]|uniref:non-specific serine/threonine protein kinase n=1 Tax=Alkalilimnicola ehrlichii TaxID=351052 RepID=A0A3E0WRT5_9GAMM|nr:PA4780 family RIO1-like protein kinase [Alkalilimnicola ehrlichii]RFA25790.1 serine protein kinase RIO [Alkalilimnicola ehrlichii]RFA35109.1 serine protein kinase RIO [Alkalilimnicola ehrlichii]
MKPPKRIQPLIDDGLVDEVLYQLKSGKEASVYVVRCGDDIRCAKVYKEANKRGFRTLTQYQEGRTVRNSRRARAMAKGTRYGRDEQEAVWQSAEVDALYRLADAGVRVPQPHLFLDGVLVMALIKGPDGDTAPRLGDVVHSAAQARSYYRFLIAQVVRMLCAGLIHGDLSEYNVLVDSEGPVIIDLPQAVNAAGNNNASRMLTRDIDNLTAYFSRFVPELASTDYAHEIWALYENGELTPDTELTGHFQREERPTDLTELLREIGDAREEAMQRQRDEYEEEY